MANSRSLLQSLRQLPQSSVFNNFRKRLQDNVFFSKHSSKPPIDIAVQSYRSLCASKQNVLLQKSKDCLEDQHAGVALDLLQQPIWDRENATSFKVNALRDMQPIHGSN